MTLERVVLTAINQFGPEGPRPGAKGRIVECREDDLGERIALISFEGFRDLYWCYEEQYKGAS